MWNLILEPMARAMPIATSKMLLKYSSRPTSVQGAMHVTNSYALQEKGRNVSQRLSSRCITFEAQAILVPAVLWKGDLFELRNSPEKQNNVCHYGSVHVAGPRAG